jgi:hypothetical protein
MIAAANCVDLQLTISLSSPCRKKGRPPWPWASVA